MNKYKSYEDFLNKTYPKLYFSKEVQHLYKNGDTRDETVKKYIEKLERIHTNAFSSKRESDVNLLKSFYYDKYIIKKENISEGYIKFLDKQYFDTNGIHMTDEMKKIHIENIINDQRKSLDEWIDYLSCEDAFVYPMWAKYWAFQGMLTIGAFDNKNNVYKKRTKDTTQKFVDLNREVLAKCIDYIIKLVNDGQINNLEQINGENFSKIYQVLLGKFKEITFDKTSINGKWVKYEQGDNYLPLYNSIQGYGTGWCTAGEDTCKNQIKSGDFYVYYTLDKDGNPVIPRIAIRMDGQTRIGEIRGVAEGQNVESHLEEVLEEKLKEFPDRKDYEMRISDSKKLTEIYTKYEKNIELTSEDLKFIYETERKVRGFGYREDPRITTIKNSRNIIDDYSKIYNVNKNEIISSQEQYLDNPSKYKILIGDLILPKVTKAEGQLPIVVTGNLDLSGLIDSKDLILPQNLGGNLDLRNLKRCHGLELPQSVGGAMWLDSLTSVKNLKLPQFIGGDLNLGNLTSAESLDLSQTIIGGCLRLSSLTNTKGLKLPQNLGGNLNLDSLVSIDDLIFPQSIGGDLYLRSLEGIKDLKLPQSIGRDLHLNMLVSARNLDFPTSIGGNLILDRLISAEGLKLPKYINGGLALRGLTSADGLELPEDFDLDNLYCRPEVEEQIMERKGFKK